MSQVEAPELKEDEIQTASVNYIDCLNLPSKSQVLIITDLIPEGVHQLDPNKQVRDDIARRIQRQLDSQQTVSTIRFDGSMSKDDIQAYTAQAIQELGELKEEDGDDNLTIVYLGDAWNNRRGIYDAATFAGSEREVRVAGSLGFSTGDCRVMSQMGSEQRRIIQETNQYFETFFSEQPQGTFILETTDGNNQQYSLEIDYNTESSPFETELGRFDPGYKIKKRDYEYVNIPGGEKFGCPFPFENTHGQFFAEGIRFTVEKGMAIGAEIIDSSLVVAESSQTELLRIIHEGGSIPVAELGLGFYALAGVQTYPDSSVLSREKQGPHIGMGNDPNGKSPEGGILKERSGDFYHTDFVLGKEVVIKYKDPQMDQVTVFYPPLSPQTYKISV